MGDKRFDPHLRRILEAEDKAAALRGMRDEEVVQALAAASNSTDPYLANVLATEAMNRMRRAQVLAGDLAASEARYKALFNSVREPIVAAGIDRNITECNAAFEELVGYTADELRGRSSALFYPSLEEWEETGRLMRDDLERGERTRSIKRRFRTRSGALIEVAIRGFYVRDAAGNVVGIVAMVHEEGR